MSYTYAIKLDVCIRKIDTNIQKVDKSYLNSIKMIILD